MRCNKCGFEWYNNVNVCPRCGTPVNGAVQNRNVQNNQNIQQGTYYAQNQQQFRQYQQQVQNPRQQPTQPNQPPVQNMQQRPAQPMQQQYQPQPQRPVQPAPQQYQQPVKQQAQYPQQRPVQPVQQPVQQVQYKQPAAQPVQNAMPSQQMPPAGGDGAAAAKKRGKSKKLAIIIPVVAVFLIIALLATMIAIGKKDTDTTSSYDSTYNQYDSDVYMTSNGSNSGSKTDGKYTLMIYMVGADLESDYRAATKDLTEIASNNLDLENINIIIYAGGTTSWSMPLSSSEKNYLKLAEKEDGTLGYEKLLSGESGENMSAPSALTSFLDYSYENYPADSYGLICWNHGAGNYGFGHDTMYGNGDVDLLTVDEMQSALDASPFKDKNKLDWLGFDACLMGTIEVGHALKDYAKYMVASENSEAGDGWDYSFLEKINETSDPVEIGKSIVSTYEEFYRDYPTGYLQQEINATLSLVDLSKSDGVYNGLISYLTAVQNDVNSSSSTMSNGDRDLRCFGKDSGFDLYDVVDVVDSTSSVTASETSAVKDAVSEFVLSNTSTLDRCSGVSFGYTPPSDTNKTFKLNSNSEYNQFYEEINKSIKDKSKKKNVSWKLGEVKKDGKNNTLTLTADQKADLAYAYYNIMFDSGDEKGEVYTPVVTNYEIKPDKNGNLKVPASPSVISIVNTFENGDESGKSVFPVKMTSKSKSDTSFSSINSLVWKDVPLSTTGDFEHILVTFTNDKDNNLTVNELKVDNDTDTNGKNTLNINEWGSIGYGYRRYVKEDKPYDEWVNDGFINASYNYIGSDISFCNAKTEDFGDDFVAQIVLVDSQGNRYATSVFELNNCYTEKVKTKDVKTKNGTLTFDVSSDHAELIKYSGGDKKIEIPEKVNGLEVTKIGSYVFGSSYFENEACENVVLPETVKELSAGTFAYMNALKTVNIPKNVESIPDACFMSSGIKKITIPKGIKRIGRYAFRSSEIESIDLSKTVNDIGKGVFYSCVNLKKITINGKDKSRYFKVIDGYMLLTKNGKEVVACANTSESAEWIKIPDNVEVIRDYAFAGCIQEKFPFDSDWGDDQTYVTKLQLPDTLKYIGDFAFKGCITLKKIELPESVTYIGNEAFSSYLFQVGETIENIKIGKNVAKISNGAFEGYNVKSFTVDKDNRFYSSVNGKLMNKGGDFEIPVLAKEDDDDDDSGTYYDMKGKAYSSRDEVLYYDKKGNTYTRNSEDGCFYNTKTNKKLEGYPLFDLDGYMIVFDSYHDYTSARLTADNEIVYEVTDIEWDAKGKIVENSYSKDKFYDRNGKSYKKLTDVPYYTKDGKVYYPKVNENNFIQKFEEKGTNNVISRNEAYITSDGYLFITKTSVLDYVYTDYKGNVFLADYSVMWNKEGKLVNSDTGKVYA